MTCPTTAGSARCPWPATCSPTGRGHEYHLTPAGKDLHGVLEALGRWAVEWRFDELSPHDADAAGLMWWMHRHVDTSQLPPRRVVVEFCHTEPERRVLWVVLDRGEASVCLQHPGFDTDVLVTASTPALGEVFSGFATWASAVASGAVRIDGPPTLVRALPQWFPAHSFAPLMRAQLEARERQATATDLA